MGIIFTGAHAKKEEVKKLLESFHKPPRPTSKPKNHAFKQSKTLSTKSKLPKKPKPFTISQTAKTLIQAANGKTVNIGATGSTGVADGTININMNDFKIEDEKVKEAAESIIFEINNAVYVVSKKEKHKNDLKDGKHTLLEYGLKMAKEESSSSLKLATILKELTGVYKPSKFGQGHLTNAFKGTKKFSEGAHNKDKAKEEGCEHFGLCSNQFYAYEVIAGSKDDKRQLGRIVDIVNNMAKVSRKGMYNTKTPIDNLGKELINQTHSTNRDKFYVCYIALLEKLSRDSKYEVKWKGNAKNWQFTEEMKKLVILGPDKHDPAGMFEETLKKSFKM
jgi:hypothetical protein